MEQKTTTYQITLGRATKDQITVADLEAFLRKYPRDGVVSIQKRDGFGQVDQIKVTKRKALDDGK